MDKLSASKYWDELRNQVHYDNVTAGSNKNFYWTDKYNHSWVTSKERILRTTSPCPYCNNRQLLKGFNDLKSLYPEVVKEFHPTLNKILPTEVLGSSTQKFWWVCSKGHEWETKLNLRTKTNSKCPTCSGKRILEGFNDLTTTHPHLLKEWDKNNNLLPTSISASSKRKIKWVCDKEHKWEAQVINRSRLQKPSGCPVCVNQKIVPGVNDLQTSHPQVAEAWDTVRNVLSPTEVGAGNKTKIWWVEPVCGHTYELNIDKKVKAKNCQVCINRIVVPGVNDLATINPQLAKEWHPTKNTVNVNLVTSGNSNRVWWMCSKDHEWEATPNDRNIYDTKCPYCSNQKVLQGFNDLQTLHPQLASQWSKKNLHILPTQVTPGADVKVLWECDKGHEWEALVYSRTSTKRATNCPMCSRKRVIPGETDLGTLNPSVALEWHTALNGDLTPNMVTAFSNKKVWWLCIKNHKWLAAVNNRHQGKGCPDCSSRATTSKSEREIFGYLKSKGFNVIENSREVLDGKELDIYIPEKQIAIEYNGLYWHTEKFRTRTYHYDKWKACKDKGIQLIQVWEDDYVRNPQLIHQMLLHKLGGSEQVKLYARKLDIIEVSDDDDAYMFLKNNHIQGWGSTTIFYGLRHGVDIVAVLGLKKTSKHKKDEYTLTRYATSQNVVGGFSKLLTHAEKTIAFKTLTTYSDNQVSDGAYMRVMVLLL